VPSFVRPFVGRTLHKFGGVLGAQVNASAGKPRARNVTHLAVRHISPKLSSRQFDLD
jgi:hypothetical protein